MKEKELRLALVCYGGVSLAIYMHGVTKEILKLVRASKSYHGIDDPEARRRARYGEVDTASDRELDTETVYFEILQAIGDKLDLRVMVDIIAGASAGGINGALLARALARDLSIDGVRKVWLEQGDVAELLAPERMAHSWSKWFLRPLIWSYTRFAADPLRTDGEMRRKLSLFLRSRWFRPPFDGSRMSEVLLNAIGRMAPPKDPASSLLPEGQRLELFVTVTDFFGYPRQIQIHDPAVIREREHRHVLRFDSARWHNGKFLNDFDDEGVPALAFAARATASFPGAFPPAQFLEIDRLLESRGERWDGRQRFIEANFQNYFRAGIDPALTSFVDGSVLNNKPFAEAMQAIQDRPAFRPVDRRLVYIDPNPSGPPPPPTGRRPGFFRTLKAALSDIPRQEPIYDDLDGVARFNRRIRRAKAVVASAYPHVEQQVDRLAPDGLSNTHSEADMAKWREAAQASAARGGGFAYDGYFRLRLDLAVRATARRIARILEYDRERPETQGIVTLQLTWLQSGAMLGSGNLPAEGEVAAQERGYLDNFDAAFRLRRIRFLIQSLNKLYGRLGQPGSSGNAAKDLNLVKAQLYQQLDRIHGLERTASAALGPANLQARFDIPELHQILQGGERAVDALAAAKKSELDRAMSALAKVLRLGQIDTETDKIFVMAETRRLPESARHDLLTAYIGFAFWDVLTYPLTSRDDYGEFNEVRVDRISPDDADFIRQGGARATLKGIEFGHFGAFFSRRHRENDYLWGRLHGAERMIDMLFDTAAAEDAAEALDIDALKKRIFKTILQAEAPYLTSSEKLLVEIEAEIDAGSGARVWPPRVQPPRH